MRVDHISRRGFLGATATAIASGSLLDEPALGQTPKDADEALAALKRGNARYRTNKWRRKDYSPVAEERASAQAPFAAILTCADSRLSPPLIFDVERGNLFSAHVAGNALSDDIVGSLEYAVAVLKVPLVVVLGHSDCGAVKAAMDVVAGKTKFPRSTFGQIGKVVSRITPAIEELPKAQRTLGRCIHANAAYQSRELIGKGPIMYDSVVASRVRIVPAVYEIKTGRVRWL
jgi:carbonic anhydrase